MNLLMLIVHSSYPFFYFSFQHMIVASMQVVVQQVVPLLGDMTSVESRQVLLHNCTDSLRHMVMSHIVLRIFLFFSRIHYPDDLVNYRLSLLVLRYRELLRHCR